MKTEGLPLVKGELENRKPECKATTQAAELDPGPERERISAISGKPEQGLKTD